MATKAEHVTALKAQHPTLRRMVNGVYEELSTSEYEAKIDEWATISAAQDIYATVDSAGGAHVKYAQLRTDARCNHEVEEGESCAEVHGYPRIPDQLDMLFHDITDGKLDETGSWYLAIKATKDKFTKP